MPRIDPFLIAVVPRLCTWAQGHPNIRRVWLYGSRVKGTQRADSDLGIAVEIDVIDETAATLEWIDHRATYARELDDVVRHWPVHLEMHETPKVSEYVADSGQLIYERR